MDLESDKAVTCQSLREPLLSEEFQTSNDDSRVQVKLRRFKIALIGSAATIIALAALSVVFYLQTLPRCQGIQTPSSVLLPECQYALDCQFPVIARLRDFHHLPLNFSILKTQIPHSPSPARHIHRRCSVHRQRKHFRRRRRRVGRSPTK